MTRRLIRDFVNRPVEPPTARASVAGAAGLDHLTVREREILTRRDRALEQHRPPS